MTTTAEQIGTEYPRIDRERFEELLRSVAALQAGHERVSDLLATSQEAWRHANAGVIERKAELGVALENVRTELKAAAVLYFQSTGDKHPIPGVTVKERTSLRYDPDAAFEWAKTSGIALTLDRKTFDRVAPALDLPFVEKIVTPAAEITQTPEKFLAIDAETGR